MDDNPEYPPPPPQSDKHTGNGWAKIDVDCQQSAANGFYPHLDNSSNPDGGASGRERERGTKEVKGEKGVRESGS